MTMNISKTKIDDKGRIQLPSHFLKANDIEVGTYVIIQSVYNNSSACKMESKENRVVQSITKSTTKRPQMDWIDNKTLQLMLDIVWEAEGVSMQDWREISQAIENLYGGNTYWENQANGKDLVIRDLTDDITNLKSRIEDLEKERIVLSTKYGEARDEAFRLGADISKFNDIGELINNYLESKSSVQDMDGNTIYKEDKTNNK